MQKDFMPGGPGKCQGSHAVSRGGTAGADRDMLTGKVTMRSPVPVDKLSSWLPGCCFCHLSRCISRPLFHPAAVPVTDADSLVPLINDLMRDADQRQHFDVCLATKDWHPKVGSISL